MNSYFFFGFHIFKDFNVTIMCHSYPKSTLNRTTKENIQIVMTIPDNNETGTPGFFRDGNDGDSYLLFHADM